MIRSYLKICLITHWQEEPFSSYKKFLSAAIRGGVTSIQFRDKIHSEPEQLRRASALKTLLNYLNIPLFINDNIDLAKKIDAAGVHLGQNDQDVNYARTILGKNKWIGLSIETVDELKKANQNADINYIAASAVFLSQTKECKTIWGLEGLRQLCTLSLHPVIAIGGINLKNINSIIKAGAIGCAVISLLHQATNPYQTAKELSSYINLPQPSLT